MIAVAASAAMVDSSLRTVAVGAGFDGRQIHVAGELAIHHIVAIETGESFLVEGVVEFPYRHPAIWNRHFRDHRRAVVILWLGNFVAGRTASEGDL